MKYIIDFVNSATDVQIDEYLTNNACSITKTFSVFEKCYLVESEIKPPSSEIVESVINDFDTVIAPLTYTENSQITIDLTTEDNWWKTISLMNIDLGASSWTIERKGINACVYVMDSGVNIAHPDFEDAEISNLYSFNDDYTDYNGHGTAIASVISGKTCGISSAKIKSVKIFQNGVSTYQSHILAALDSIYNDVVANSTIFPVINISWAIPKNLYIESKIQKLINNHMSVVCAAGNNGQPVGDVTPASMMFVLAVGAFNRQLVPCDFSNYPSAITNSQGITNYGRSANWLWAPGEHIKSAVGDGYDFVAGTSIAAAIASAAVAVNSYLKVRPDGVVTYKMKNNIGYGITGPIHGQSILDLSNGYDQSRNNIVGFQIGKYGNGIDNINVSAINEVVPARSGEPFDFQLYTPDNVKSAELLTELPDGLTQLDNFIIGTVNTSTYLVKDILYAVTFHNGYKSNFHRYLYVTSGDYTLENIPAEDQIVDIELLAVFCCRFTQNIGCVQGTGCNLCTLCGNKISGYCVCTNSVVTYYGIQLCGESGC